MPLLLCSLSLTSGTVITLSGGAALFDATEMLPFSPHWGP